jgi:hypothetical protein
MPWHRNSLHWMPKYCFITLPRCFLGTDYYSYIFLNLSEVKPHDVLSGYPHSHPLLLTKPCIMPSFLDVRTIVWLVGWFVYLSLHHRLLFDIFWQSIVWMTLLQCFCMSLLSTSDLDYKSTKCATEDMSIHASRFNNFKFLACETHRWNPLDEPAPTLVPSWWNPQNSSKYSLLNIIFIKD